MLIFFTKHRHDIEQRNNVNKSRQARSRPVPAHANSTQVYPRLTLGKRAIARFLLETDLLHNNFIVSILPGINMLVNGLMELVRPM